MAITLAGTTGITTPGLTNSGNETITGTLNVGGLTPNVYPIVSGTAVASTSGTSIDFTSIPSWVKRITVMFSGVSTSGTSPILLQIGAGSVDATGYNCSGINSDGINVGGANYTTGFALRQTSAAMLSGGSVVLNTLGSNIWAVNGFVGTASAVIGIFWTAGNKSLSGTLDRVRITTVNGTDTFDAGSINLLWE